MYKESQYSIYEYLLQLRPDLQKHVDNYQQRVVTKDSADILFSIWKNTNNKVSNKIYNKPSELKDIDLERLQKEGLIQNHQGKLQITAKGSEVIKTMVLGDNRSCFEDDGSNINYKIAKINTETSSAKIRKQGKSKEEDWWSRY